MTDKPGTEPSFVPETLKHGKVLYYAVLNERNELTGKTKRMIDGKPILQPAALAVVHYELSQGGVYLFYCDKSWRVVATTWHYSPQDAMNRGDYEFTNLNWQRR